MPPELKLGWDVWERVTGMIILRIGFTSAALWLALASAGARADEDAPSPVRGEAVSMAAYGSWNADCLEWSNACVICQREAGGKAACSTPGIACQPKGIVCERRVGTPVAQPAEVVPVVPETPVVPKPLATPGEAGN